ncbi:Vmc-like lipoprotein signal peptide domain-containing protein [Spiroplasma endosymbiont of Cantharis lateralis]|uniref:Vmc-like lipoprotein signal peptide domain-containing protein n=1 Tax=Spiroplasma endosymbiont of Cantharis lateralis TaxID=3066277 RepID=UPI00313CFE79
MKKLLSVLGSLLVVAPSISAVVSCGIETNPIKITIDEKEEFKIANNKINFQKLFGSAATLPVLANLILESLTFSETKYPNIKKREEQKKVLGEKGLGMALENLFIDGEKDYVEFIDNTIDKQSDESAFRKDYEAPKNSNFIEINYNLGITKSELSENEKWTASNASVYEASNALTMNTKIDYKDGKVQKIQENQDGNKKNLKDYIELKWKESNYNKYFNEGEFSSYKDKKIYNMTDEDANELYTKIKESQNEEMKKDLGVNSLTQAQFKTLHTQLNKVDEKFRNGILMPGKFDGNFVQSDAEFKQCNAEDCIEARHDISTGVAFYTANDGKSMQAQVVGSKENDKRTFIYGKSDNDQKLSIDFIFNAPGDKKDSKERNYKLKLTLDNLIVGYQLNGIVLEKGFDNDNKERTDEVIYWYEPSIYQFTEEEIFRAGNDDIFKDLQKAKLEIETI